MRLKLDRCEVRSFRETDDVDEIPAVARKVDLDIISWHCTWTGPDVEVVDITLEIEKHHEDH